MKRGARPFTVEVRRGQRRLSADEPHEPQFDLVQDQPSTMRDDALRRAEAALFGFREPEPPVVVGDPGAPATGRILKNLAEVDPVAVALVGDAPPRRRGRKPGSVNRPKTPDEKEKVRPPEDTAARHVPLTPEVVSAALKAIEKSTPVIPRPAERRSREVTAAEPLSPKSRETFGFEGQRKPERAPDHPAASLRADAAARPAEGNARSAPVIVHSAAEPAAAETAESSGAPRAKAAPGRRVSIMGRYVFGTELRPGEQWKRLLPWRR